MVETVLKTVESRQLVLLLDKVVDVPLLATSWVAVHRLVCELMRRLFRALYTGTRPGLTDAIRVVKGWRGRRELAPRCSATQIRCIVVVHRQRFSMYTRSAPQPPQPPHPRDGSPSCRGRGGSVASHVLTPVGDMAGEARSQPGGC